MARNNTIYIIGFMGSGKTTVGRKLASLLGWLYVDLDKKIEQNAGMTIPEMFSKKGEAYFRTLESETLKKTEYPSNTVVSTGGGTPCYSDNMEFMLSSGLTIYLKMTPVQLKSRLGRSHGERPLIKDLDPTQLLTFIEEKLKQRESWYNRSQIIIEGIDPDYESLVKLVRLAGIF